MSVSWIADDRSLIEFVGGAVDDRYAIDTEFHRERTYFPQLALVQLRLGSQVALIDPLSCDVANLIPLFKSDATCVLHAGSQDLEILMLACGVVPARVYDTQIAAGFLGHSQISLASLVFETRGVSIPKADRLTDWLRRPLSKAQETYAASDVEHLLEIHDAQRASLASLGREAWVEEACSALVARSIKGSDPDDAWLKVKDARSLKGESRGVAKSLARWREHRAMRLNVPVRRVLSDMALVSIAQARPRDNGQLQQCRGVDPRQLGGEVVDEILVAVRAGSDEQVVLPESRRPEVDSRLRAVVPLLIAWAGERAKSANMDPAFLATRQDIDEFVSGGTACRLRVGWRAEMLLEDFESLVSGRVGLGVDGKGRLKLISSEPNHPLG